MGGTNKVMWLAIILIGALLCAIIAAQISWAASSQQSPGSRTFGALSAAGVTFLGVAGLGIAIAVFLS